MKTKAHADQMVRKLAKAPTARIEGSSNVGGMTPNERLFRFGLLEEFDRATLRRDRAAMIRILSRAHFPDGAPTVDAILKDPTLHGLLKR